MVVPQASMPLAKEFPAVLTKAALFVQFVPVPLPPAAVLNNFTTIELGRTPVSVLLTRSPFADKETKPLGVTRHEQQLTNCSSGENA